MCSLSYFSFTLLLIFFFFNDTATTEIYTLSLHDALPISWIRPAIAVPTWVGPPFMNADRKSTRLNSSHEWISYAVFCSKKKKISCMRAFPDNLIMELLVSGDEILVK